MITHNRPLRVQHGKPLILSQVDPGESTNSDIDSCDKLLEHIVNKDDNIDNDNIHIVMNTDAELTGTNPIPCSHVKH